MFVYINISRANKRKETREHLLVRPDCPDTDNTVDTNTGDRYY